MKKPNQKFEAKSIPKSRSQSATIRGGSKHVAKNPNLNGIQTAAKPVGFEERIERLEIALIDLAYFAADAREDRSIVPPTLPVDHAGRFENVFALCRVVELELIALRRISSVL